MIRFDHLAATLAVVLLGVGTWALLLVLTLRQKRAQISEYLSMLEKTREDCAQDAQRVRSSAQQYVDDQVRRFLEENNRVRQHYEAEARKLWTELQPLGKYREFASRAEEAEKALVEAMREATALRSEAQSLLGRAKADAAEEFAQAKQEAGGIRKRADALLETATRDAARIVSEAHARAKEIAGDAYVAMREKEAIAAAAQAARNLIEGYGDRYLVPARSVLDELAAHFAHATAGDGLRSSRAHSQRLVETGHAATCDYAEAARRETAIRFVIDAFNGRVDAILTRTKGDNFGTLQQEIRDAFSLVNQNGRAFRDARILPEYLDSRLMELKWAVAVQELRQKEREEQRRIQEQMREEEKARRDYERAIREAQRDEEVLKKALEKARTEIAHSTASERAVMEARLAELNQRLAEAEAKNRRALSMAQQTRAGHVYVISNIGSFGEEVFKIGLTRRLEPLDRIWELSDASVPFDFDVHVMIYSEDAPALERLLHEHFEYDRVNKVNLRKEFFRLPLGRIRELIEAQKLTAKFTMVAEAYEFRETQALDRMAPAERIAYRQRLAAASTATVTVGED